MPNVIATLKLDFKFDEDNILRIVDIGDGIGAGMQGFEDTPIAAKTLSDMHELSGARVATLFGELPYDALQPESLHVPLLLRPLGSENNLLSTKDFPNSTPILPYVHYSRLTSFVSCDWGHQKETVITTPVALMAMEMHKVLWYFLMEKHVPSAEQKPVAYWRNDKNPTAIDLSDIDMSKGVFVKIADRSQGGADGVYYAKNEAELFKITRRLHQAYPGSNERYDKHLFVIEPAYVTPKEYNRQIYNVTGRAFVTLAYNESTDSLEVKVSGAKWMFPFAPMTAEHSTPQMLSNLKNSIDMLPLNDQEMAQLSSGILTTYGDVIKAGFNEDNLMTYCHSHPQMSEFVDCMRPNSSYIQFLNRYYLPSEAAGSERSQDQFLLHAQINSLLMRDVLPDFNQFLMLFSHANSFFSPPELTSQEVLQRLCDLSFFEGYITQMKTADPQIVQVFNFIPSLIKNEAFITSKLDSLLTQYLVSAGTKKNSYDITDRNRALRQAAAMGNVIVMKLLIYTRRADVNALSPSKKTVKDVVLASKNEAMKPQLLALLDQLGATVGQPSLAADEEASSTPPSF